MPSKLRNELRLAILAGSHAIGAGKGTDKGLRIPVADVLADVRDTHLRVAQKIFALLKPYIADQF